MSRDVLEQSAAEGGKVLEDDTDEEYEFARVLFLMHPWFVSSTDLVQRFTELYPLELEFFFGGTDQLPKKTCCNTSYML